MNAQKEKTSRVHVGSHKPTKKVCDENGIRKNDMRYHTKCADRRADRQTDKWLFSFSALYSIYIYIYRPFCDKLSVHFGVF